MTAFSFIFCVVVLIQLSFVMTLIILDFCSQGADGFGPGRGFGRGMGGRMGGRGFGDSLMAFLFLLHHLSWWVSWGVCVCVYDLFIAKSLDH